jgi:putative PIN family toxin of toxin-antitoxin system
VSTHPRAVLDTSVVVSAIGWSGGEAQKVLWLLAKRRFICVRSPYLTLEWALTVERVAAENPGSFRNVNWANWLEWLNRRSELIEDPPMRPIVRDPKDDPILGTAIAGKAQYLISYDHDLLDLGQPYGVQCLPPRAFLHEMLAKA